MGRILLLVLGLVAIAFAVKYELAGTMGNSAAARTQPKERLDNVRSKAHQFELDDQQRADDALKKSEAQ